jgi:hypothetical protein
MGIGRMIERAGEGAALPFPVHASMRTCSGIRLDTRWQPRAWTLGDCNTFWAMPASQTQSATPQCHRSPSRTFGGELTPRYFALD